METTAARLIVRAQQGDPAAFAELYDRHHEAIYTYVYYRVGGNVPVAEDLTGDVFVRMVEHIDRFVDQGRPIRAWLYTIARNLVTGAFSHWGSVGLNPRAERAKPLRGWILARRAWLFQPEHSCSGLLPQSLNTPPGDGLSAEPGASHDGAAV